MLKELLEHGFGCDLDLNCAKKIVYGANHVYNMGLSPQALKLAAGFGGGMGIESVCGTLTGGVMVLSNLYVKRNAHESERIKELESEFISRSIKKWAARIAYLKSSTEKKRDCIK